MLSKKIIVITLILMFSITVVSAETLDVTKEDTYQYFSEDTPASQSGYSYAVVIDDVPYYISPSVESDLCEISPSFSSFYSQETSLNYDKSTSYEGYAGGQHVKLYEGGMFESNDVVEDTEFENDADFTIEWETGEVGLNDNAHIITKVSA